jgi:superfamily II DNA helicase RecQ
MSNIDLSILSYWQEAGRCARDGRQGFSLILCDGFTLALKTTDKDMAAVVKNDSKTCKKTLGDENMSMSQTSSSSCEATNLGYLIPFLKQRLQ